MFGKILVANRGEIACRVIRTARRLGIRTVAVYSDADVDALHVSMADEAVHIGGAAPRKSYLNGEAIVQACLKTGAEAVHPGYGFLSENAEFCRLCAENGLVFIGPPEAAIRAMGSKSAAKTIMEKAGVPLLPGFHGENASDERLMAAANDVGYPVLLKAVAGGGGKGMRVVWDENGFDAAVAAARRESQASFGNDDMLVEKFLPSPRHVELQVFCDQHDNAVHLFERDCSVQRRHQKILEEAPAPGLSDALREAMGAAAVRAAQAIDYQGAGTVEFLLEPDGSFYFMEMNTRLQVEHPVTEMITGQDLVEWQLRVASGEPLPLSQDQLSINGHAFEARVYAEDPENDFLPATGTLKFLQPPAENPHVRVDTGVLQGDEVSVHYDPMIAKLIVWDESRGRALSRLATALSHYRISGLKTNIPFLYNLANHPSFREADFDTGFIEQHRASLFHDTDVDRLNDLPLASLYLLLRLEQQSLERASSGDPYSPWNAGNAWRLNAPAIFTGGLVVGDTDYDMPVEEIGTEQSRRFRITVGDRSVIASGTLDGNELHADVDGFRRSVVVVPHDDQFTLFSDQGSLQFSLRQPDLGDMDAASGPGAFSAPMSGVIVKHLVGANEPVEKGQGVIVMEAMKMEHTLVAPAAGQVEEFYYAEGEQVDGGVDLLSFKSGE